MAKDKIQKTSFFSIRLSKIGYIVNDQMVEGSISAMDGYNHL